MTDGTPHGDIILYQTEDGFNCCIFCNSSKRGKQKLDEFLSLSGKDLLTHAGTVSAEIAKQKADSEYDKYSKRIQHELLPVEIHFIESFEKEVRQLKK